MTPESSAAGSLSLKEKKEESLFEVLNTSFNWQKGSISRKVHIIEPRKGSIITTSFFGTVWTGSYFSKTLLTNRRTHLSKKTSVTFEEKLLNFFSEWLKSLVLKWPSRVADNRHIFYREHEINWGKRAQNWELMALEMRRAPPAPSKRVNGITRQFS